MVVCVCHQKWTWEQYIHHISQPMRLLLSIWNTPTKKDGNYILCVLVKNRLIYIYILRVLCKQHETLLVYLINYLPGIQIKLKEAMSLVNWPTVWKHESQIQNFVWAIHWLTLLGEKRTLYSSSFWQGPQS